MRSCSTHVAICRYSQHVGLHEEPNLRTPDRGQPGWPNFLSAWDHPSLPLLLSDLGSRTSDLRPLRLVSLDPPTLSASVLSAWAPPPVAPWSRAYARSPRMLIYFVDAKLQRHFNCHVPRRYKGGELYILSLRHWNTILNRSAATDRLRVGGEPITLRGGPSDTLRPQ